MGTSIQKGIQYITGNTQKQTMLSSPFATNLIFLLFIKRADDSAKQTGKGIIASAYNNTHGTPVLFAKKYFGHLATLSGQHGAKKIIQGFSTDVETVNFPFGYFDIDTPQDYDRLNSI